MDITVIGYWGAYPERDEATSGYLVECGATKILLDCGSGVLSKLQNYCAIEELDAVVITHTHADHIADAFSLEFAVLVLSQLGKRKKPLDYYVYGENLERLPFQFPDHALVHPIRIGERLSIGETRLDFSANVHDVPCCAVRVTSDTGRTLVYSGDTGYCNNIVELSRSADALLLECSFYDWQKGVMNGHLTAGEAGEIAALAEAGQLVLTHLPHYGEHRQLIHEASRQYEGWIRLAYSGMKIKI